MVDARAVPFIEVNDEDNTFSVSEDGVRLLSTITAPLSVIAIVGVYRSGKSFLLNSLLGDHRNDTGFVIGNTVKACTRGIWISTSGPREDGTNVIFMDTEGTSSTNKDASYDSRIFSLAILLASHILYNSVGAIDEKSIAELSLVTHLTRHIHVRSAAADEDDGRGFAEYFPRFTWVLRDFTLQLAGMSTDEYLEQSLKQQPGFSEAVMSKNRVRAMINEFFRQRNCVALVRPLNDESQLQNIRQVDPQNMRPEFLQCMKELSKGVLAHPCIKSVSGRQLNGAMLAELARCYVHAINTGSVPTIMSAWDSVIELQSKRAVECGKAAFAQNVAKIKSESQVLHADVLKGQLRSAKHLAMQAFDAAIVDGNPKAKEELELYFTTECHTLKQRNLELSLNDAKKAATEFWKTAVQSSLSLKDAEKLTALVGASISMIGHVHEHCVGGNVDRALLQILSEVSMPQLSNASAHEIQILLQALAACESVLAGEKSGRAMEKKDAEHASEVAASRIQSLSSRQEELTAELAREKQLHQTDVSKLEGDLAAVKCELKDLRESSQHTIDGLRGDLHGTQVQLGHRDAQIHTLESDVRSNKDRCAGLTEQLSEMKQTAKELEAKRTSEREGADKRIEQMREEMLQQRSEAKINEKSLEEKLHARALDIERMRHDYNSKEVEMRSEIKTTQSSLEKARAETADAVQKAQIDIRNITTEFRGREDKLQAQVLDLTEKAAGFKRDLEASRAQIETLQGSLKEAQETIVAKAKTFEEIQLASKEEKRALKEEHLRLREEISVARHVADDEKNKAAAETARVAGIELAKQEAIARSDAEKDALRDLVVSFRRVAVQTEKMSRLEKRLSAELQVKLEEQEKSIGILDDALYKSRLTLQEHLFEETESAVREKADRESRRSSALADLFKSHKDEALHFKKRCDELTKLAGSLNEVVGDKEAKLKALNDEKDILRRRSEELQKKGQVLERRLFNLEHALEEKKPTSLDELDQASIAMVVQLADALEQEAPTEHLAVGLPGSKPPQIESPQPPVKAETTAAALQLLQPKASHPIASAARKEPSNPSISPEEPPAVQLTHAAEADTARPSSPQSSPSAQLAREHSPSPSPTSSDGVAANALDVSVTARPTTAASDDEVHSDASDSDTSPHEHDRDHEQHQEEQTDAVAVTALPVQPAAAPLELSSEDSESEDEITKASKQ